MGMHVPSPVDAGEPSPCACLIRPPSAGRQDKDRHDRRMSLPSPAELSVIEIEDAHTPIPLGGFPGGSPTGEVIGTPGRPHRERNHSGGGFVTLKRKGVRDVVRQAHARSASAGSVGGKPAGSCRTCGGGGGGTPVTCSEFFSGGGGGGGSGGGGGNCGYDERDHVHDLEANEPLGPPSPMPFRRPSGSGSVGGRGSGSGRRGSGTPGSAAAAVASLEDAAQRIAVDPDSGHSYFVERSTVCDACPYCEDTCEVAWCNGCDETRMHLEEAYGKLMLSAAEVAGAGGRHGGGGGGCETGADNGGGSRLKLAPVLSRRYPRKSSYTLCEVRRRKVTGACWVVSQGSVYDVTAALPDHPGGKRSVLKNAGGRDCAEDFFFHSRAAKKQWRQYRIGSLVACRPGQGDGDGGAAGDERSMRIASSCVIS
ncbi:conserved unknown protein [Ectocarpus siliculosus]|uniref:Cytochrome b5 heme-binding domain-containing protein n=1 Tax=Ectocarpus siliculosus TaxID=2880 RepID=D7FHZ6_ECTSI|nr:conserved unknown protein [Ectocarpus siliculosus]|eukprot:CBJ49007.1 conserved unknown protein [Ectocarpus siliculosus]